MKRNVIVCLIMLHKNTNKIGIMYIYIYNTLLLIKMFILDCEDIIRRSCI